MTLLFSPRKRRSMFYRRWFVCLFVCVCLSVTTITKKDPGRICTKFYGNVPREDQVRVSFAIDGSNGQKTP